MQDLSLKEVAGRRVLPPLADLHHTSYGEADIERAAKDTTDRIHKLLLYTTHLVFTPILEVIPVKTGRSLFEKHPGHSASILIMYLIISEINLLFLSARRGRYR
jgi:hypothetical protein